MSSISNVSTYMVTTRKGMTDMGCMFFNRFDIVSVDLSKLDTSEVTNMGDLFSNCVNLTSVNLSNLDTSNVFDMNYMFSGCSDLTTLDLSSFDTSMVSNMSHMFWNCTNLTTIKGVIDMRSCEFCLNMFEYCDKLKGVKIKNPPSNFEERSKLRPSQYIVVS